MWSIGLYIIAAGLAPVPAAASATPTAFVSEAYLSCVRKQSEGSLPSKNLRYGDDLFASSYNRCVEKLPKPKLTEAWPDAMYRSTYIYIETLRFLNALPGPDIRSNRSASTVASAPILIPTSWSSNRVLDEIDPITSRDFAILYTPWVYCLTTSMKGSDMKEPGQSVMAAIVQCKNVSDLADTEALDALNRDGDYGTADNQKKALNEFKSTLAQLATLSTLRANGEKLGSALERSEKATHNAPNQ